MLSAEDTLKLNVLIATSVAIRIDIYKLVVVGLNAQHKEQTIELNPSGDSSKYIKEVQKLLVSQVLGAMGGYPSYLKRWSRMGQVESSNLASLLKLGDVEAVVAVSNATNLDEKLLEITWWCATNTDQQAEIGRFLLTKNFVVKTQIGKQIAEYLFEFLPFTDDIEQLIDTTNLVLQKDLIDSSLVDRLWKQGQRKTVFLVGFIERLQNNLPNTDGTIKLDCKQKELEEICTEQGQILLKTISHILKKINQEYVLYRTLEVLGGFMSHKMIQTFNTIEEITEQADIVAKNLGLQDDDKVRARLMLAGVSEDLVVSYISAHNLTGSAIRKKLDNVLSPIQDALQLLTTP